MASTRLPDLPSDLPKPEPKPEDEKIALKLRHLSEDAVLKGQPSGARIACTTARSTRRSATAGT
jgi:hypothetical protein